MPSYRSLAPKTPRDPSPRKATRERLRKEMARIVEKATLLPAAPTKLQQREAMVTAGMASDPLAGIEPHRPQANPSEASLRDPNLTEPSLSEPKLFAPSLTDRVRALYEKSILPVREIARLAGVSERTLYKYAARGGWRQRHLCLARAKGAGGRFISRGDTTKPQPSGLKALDPTAAARASHAAHTAHRLSDIAVGEALAEAELRAADKRAVRKATSEVRTLAHLTRVLRGLSAIEKAEQARETAAQATKARQRDDKANEARETEALRQELARKITALAGQLKEVSVRAVEGDAVPTRGPRIRHT
jgi:hypothetical protein